MNQLITAKHVDLNLEPSIYIKAGVEARVCRTSTGEVETHGSLWPIVWPTKMNQHTLGLLEKLSKKKAERIKEAPDVDLWPPCAHTHVHKHPQHTCTHRETETERERTRLHCASW